VDTEEQVAQLFGASQASQQDMYKKKRLVFKLVQQLKDSNQTVKVDALWKKILSLPEKEALDANKNPIIVNKPDLLRAIQELEKDNCLMYDERDHAVVLI
jgi:hypothetical protein